MNTAISKNNSSLGTIGDKVLAPIAKKHNIKKNKPKLKLGFRMADAVILLSLSKALV